MIRIHKMHLHSINVVTVGVYLALVIILLVWKLVGVQNNTWGHAMLCWWSYNSLKLIKCIA